MWKKLEGVRDVTIHSWGSGWRLKAAFIRRSLEDAMRRHHVDEMHRAELSEVMTGSLIGMDAKDEERCSITVMGDARQTFAEAIPLLGEVRSYSRPIEDAPNHMPSTTSMTRILLGAREPATTTVAGRSVSSLLRLDGGESLFWEGGGVMLQQSADVEHSDAAQHELRDLLEGCGPPREDENPTQWLERLLQDRPRRERRIWTAFHCRCKLPKNARDLGDVGDVMTCHFCNKDHVIA